MSFRSLTEVADWVSAALREPIISLGTVRAEAWSRVVKVISRTGTYYYKETSEAFCYEARLSEFLAERFPRSSPDLVAVDIDGRCFLSRDAGWTLRSLFASGQPITLWTKALGEYAELQRQLDSYQTDLLGLGITDHRTERLAELADEYAPKVSTSKVQRLALELTACGIPDSLQHDDLHDGNVLLSNNQVKLIDWGDSCVAHPFMSLVVFGKSAFNGQCAVAQTPEWCLLVRAYTSTWSESYSQDAIERALNLSACLGELCRALTVLRLANATTGSDRTKSLDRANIWLDFFEQSSRCF